MKTRQSDSKWLVGCMVIGLAAGGAAAADFTWQETPANGNWNETDANWSGAGTVWTNGSANSAFFSNSVTKAVTAAAVTLKNLNFAADGYTVGGGPLLMYGTPTVGAGFTATLTAPVTNVGVWAKGGDGTLVLNPQGAVSNIFYALKAATGTVHVAGGTNLITQTGSDPEGGPAFWVSGGKLVVGGGLLKTTGDKYARVSESGTLLVTNGTCDLSNNAELLNAHNSPGVTTVSGSGVLDLQQLRISQNTSVGSAALNVVNINTGGVIRLNNFNLDTSNKKYGTVNFNGGTCVAKADGVDLLNNGNSNWVGIVAYVLPGGAVFDSNGKYITVRQALLSGGANDGGLTKKGGGTLNLRGTNTYAGGTFLLGGSLNITNDQHLGAVPAAPATNLFFLASATLQSSASHALAASRTVWVTNAVTATFDTQSYTQTVYGTIWCAETNSTVVKSGSGMLILDPGAASSNRFGTLQTTAGTLVIASGTNVVTAPNAGQNAPGLRVSGGTMLVAGGVVKTTSLMFVNVDGGHLLITNGLVDATSCYEVLNGIGSTYGFTTVSGSGVLLANAVRVSQNTGNPSNMVVSVNTGGVLRVNNFYIDIGANQKGMLFLNGGTVEARTDNANFLGTTEVFVNNNNDKWLTNIFVHVREGGAIFNTAGKSISIKQPLYTGAAADGGLAKRGNGTLTLMNTNTYNGATSVEAGTLKLSVATNTLLPSATVWVSSNALFDVNGKVQTLAALGGSGTVTNGGFLTVTALVAPGGTNALGTLTFASVPAALGGTFKVDVATNGVCDRLHMRGNLDLSGLALSVADTAQLSKYWSYTVATYTGTQSGAFTSHNLPSRWQIKYDTAGKRVYLAYNPGTLISVR